jgi:hypothetical protein
MFSSSDDPKEFLGKMLQQGGEEREMMMDDLSDILNPFYV